MQLGLAGLLLAWLLLSAPAAAARRTREGPGWGARLRKVQELIEAEADQDKKVSDRMACWCEKNLADKRSYTEDLKQQAEGLSHEVEARAAEHARLASELEEHGAELAEGEEALGQAVAIRQKTAAKYNEEHQIAAQSVGQIDKAMEALRSSHGHELSVVQQMRRMLEGSAQAKSGALLQLRRRLGAATSPQVVYGVLREMRRSFAANLKDMQQDESLMKTRHDELSRAKAQEIEAIKRQLKSKQQRAAEGGLQLSRQRQVAERTSKLLQATQLLVSAMDKACAGSDQAAQGRQQERQQGLVAVAAAQAELAGAQLLVTSAARGRGQDLCLLGSGLSEERWRKRAQAACEAARAGSGQDAADAAEALEEDVKAALGAASAEAEACERAHQDAAADHARAVKDADVRASVVSGAKQGADAQIEEVQGQAAGCGKAKTELAEIGEATRAMLQGIRADASRISTLLQADGAAAPVAAISKIHEVTASVERLTEAASAFGSSSEKAAQDVSSALDGAMQAASKALVPLRLIRADAEEEAAAVHEEQERSAHTASAGPGCDAAALAAKVQKLQENVKQLQDASVSLAWGSLR